MFVVTHAAPAHLIVASDADHLSAATILLYDHSALGALPQTFRCDSELKSTSLLIRATAVVPSSLTLKARLLLAVCALQSIRLVFLFNLFLTILVWAPDQFRVSIDQPGESKAFKTRELFFTEILFEKLFVHYVTTAETLECLDPC